MLGLPKSTEFDRRIPKQKFYENLQITPVIKKYFVDQIKVIYWRNKIAPTTVNLAEGKAVTELEVFEISLNGQELDESVLRQIDREIPYHILFVLSYEDKYKAIIGYKEAIASGNAAFKVNRYYQTDWMGMDELPLKLDGLSLDAVYENFVRQIAGNCLHGDGEDTLRTLVEKDAKRKELERQIAALQAKIRKEKQFNRQIEMNDEVRELMKALEKVR